jgi:hypothetical protein
MYPAKYAFDNQGLRQTLRTSISTQANRKKKLTFSSTAVKLRKILTKHLDKLPKDSNSGVDISQFETIDSYLDK